MWKIFVLRWGICTIQAKSYPHGTDYAARETDTLGVSSAGLAEEARKLGTDAHYLPSFEEIEAFLKENCKSGDLLITMGAGDVVKIGEDILK